MNSFSVAGKTSKLSVDVARTLLPVPEAVGLVSAMLSKVGCHDSVAREVAEHLVDADLCGVESHGIVRILQYVEQHQNGYLKSGTAPTHFSDQQGVTYIDGGGGIGIPAMRMGVESACDAARERGVSALAIRNVGHTGRLGAFAEAAAETGSIVIIIGGGGRHNWRQVAPFGGRKALLPTNPYCMGFPGGDHGPVVIDFATSMIAGGWLHSARAAGALLPEGAIIDSDGRPSRQPADYFNGGAILPKGGPMGYGMAVMAEMLCDAMLGPASTECNWLVLALDATRYRAPGAMREAAEEILAELRNCPPAPGFDRVQIPGERERDLRAKSKCSGIALPSRTLLEIQQLADRLGVEHRGSDRYSHPSPS